MNTTALRYAVEVNRVRSISKAAQNLYMSQPNLSRAIKDLEAELGITIFKRNRRRRRERFSYEYQNRDF